MSWAFLRHRIKTYSYLKYIRQKCVIWVVGSYIHSEQVLIRVRLQGTSDLLSLLCYHLSPQRFLLLCPETAPPLHQDLRTRAEKASWAWKGQQRAPQTSPPGWKNLVRSLRSKCRLHGAESAGSIPAGGEAWERGSVLSAPQASETMTDTRLS